MRILPTLASILLSLAVVACTGVEIEQSSTEKFAAGNYQYYKWRSNPLPVDLRSADPLYTIDPILRREVDAVLQAKGFVLDPARAQFTMDYHFMVGVLEGRRSLLTDNVTPYPTATPNRQVNQAVVDNTIALSGVKETNNIILLIVDRDSNEEVWHATLSRIVEDSNQIDAGLEKNLKQNLQRALQPLPNASRR